MGRTRTGLVAIALFATMIGTPFAGTGMAAANSDVSSTTTTPRATYPAKKRVKQKAHVWMRMTGQFARHSRREMNIRRKRSQRVPMRPTVRPTAARSGSYPCVKNTNGHPVVAYEPLTIAMAGPSYTTRWQLFGYRADYARALVGPNGSYWTQQYELCGLGGGTTWNHWNSDFDGAAVTTDSWTDSLIGQKWGETVSSDGGIHTTLDFSLESGGAKVGASLPVGIDDNLRFTGSQGNDPKFYFPPPWPDVNRVNGYYTSSSTWTFQGTDRYVGNTVHALYELHQNGTTPMSWMLNVNVSAHCTKWFQILGRRCDSFT